MFQSVVIVTGATVVTLYCVRKAIETLVWKSCRNNVRLDRKIVVVTGADSGIGYETTKELIGRGAFVVLACRNLTKAHAAIEKLQKEIGPFDKYMLCELDLTLTKSVEKFVKEISEKFKQIDILINNAGVSFPKNEYRTTDSGVEIHFATNFLGHFYLSNLLISNNLFANGTENNPARVITVTSKLYERGILNFDNWFRGSVTRNCRHLYEDSKFALVHFNREFSERFHDQHIATYAVCPGFTYTNLFRNQHLPFWKILLSLPIMFFFLRSAKLGAQTSIFCATDPVLVSQSGRIYRNCAIFKSKKKVIDPKLSVQLWSYSWDILNKIKK